MHLGHCTNYRPNNSHGKGHPVQFYMKYDVKTQERQIIL